MAKTKKARLKNESRRWEVIGVLLLLLALLIFLSLFTYDKTEEPSVSSQVALKNFMGIFGVYVSHYLIKMTIGWGAFAFPIILSFGGYWLLVKKPVKTFLKLSGYILGLGIWLGTFLELPRYFSSESIWTDSSLMGLAICNFIHDFTGKTGLVLILLVALILLLSGLFNWSIPNALNIIWNWILKLWRNMISFLKSTRNRIKEYREKKKRHKHDVAPVIDHSNSPQSGQIPNNEEFDEESFPESEQDTDSEEIENVPEDEVQIHVEKEAEWQPDQGIDDDLKNIQIEEMDEIEEGDLDALKERRARYLQYKMPSIELLNSPPEIASSLSEEILREKADRLKHALSTFNVHAKVVRISPGPVITLFEMEPAEGIRVSKFTNLSDDLARIMKAQRIRIIAPIPGSKTVGIELPNDNPSTVYLRNIINSEKYINSKSKLTIAIGKTTTGDAFVMDIAKMPHLLIAGATGSG
ncbi:MAG: DNA translocase FtsK 4TM domain-containing protein, partial [Fidelibacterota bacterium]